MTDFILVYIVLIIGSCLQSVIGFGLGLLCAPVVFLLMPELVPGPMILNALLLTTLLSAKHHGEIDLKQTGFSILGGTAGVLVAGSVLLYIDSHQYQLLFGLSILFAVALSLIGVTPRLSVISNLVAAMISGFMGTTTSAGGAPMGLLYQTEEQGKIKANLSIFFVYINLFGILVLWFTGAAGHHDLQLFIQCVPAILLGWILSVFISKNINETRLRQLILLTATLSGLALIFFHD
ncbi:sulfite exporter TauE/SafE family protein [Alteromonas pelagimontana]|uniref:Probable membrane transporter protein n=1 Tax=Alteromonas pelagimontana TaxID=1858656 RepID=A0A6M4MF50_9ALTE|nr:sulfite exporter TauE/SafE family protein [Alteromonas pelagimontana]QJR81270.1 sulfite exporter TauE/SafE family protein [Alteromonas pelagimontana]